MSEATRTLPDDPRVIDVLERISPKQREHSQQRPGQAGSPTHGRGPGGRKSGAPDAFAMAGAAMPIHRDQGELIYLLCRAIGAARAVEFATSFGVSTLYFASAIRDNGGGTVIGSEIVPEKAAAAQRNLADAGLDQFVDLRVGDARETLRDLGGPVDIALIDGFPVESGPSLALQVTKIITPQLRTGGLIINDNAEDDYLDYIHDPANGFISIALPLKGSTEVSLKVQPTV